MAAISAVSAIAVAAVTCDVQHRTSFTYHSSSSTLHFPISKSHISLARRSVADLAVQWGKRISDTGAALAGVVCRSGYNVQVVVGEDEHEEILVRRFKREVFKAGVINECKRRKFFENKQDEKKRKRHEAGRRNRKRSVYFKLVD